MQNYLYDAGKIIRKDIDKKISNYIDLQRATIQTIDKLDIYIYIYM